ncbi:ATP-dependent Clp protease proteolytic subunit [Spirosoma soli]|uniref:ATP-dependent Clp protease proteolytic subunit n=1 Tax=Spirosoma soli TaxID=1770529 RepID=A0ABW5M7R8_9BACT
MLGAPYAAALQAGFPEVEQVSRLLWAAMSDDKVLLRAQQRLERRADRDYWIKAEEAKEYGFIDEVLMR